MSIMTCDKHGHWDSDFHERCPRCFLLELEREGKMGEALHCVTGSVCRADCDPDSRECEGFSELSYVTLKRTLSARDEKIAELDGQIREMIGKAAADSLDGYRELGAKCAALEERAERAEAELAKRNVVYKACPKHEGLAWNFTSTVAMPMREVCPHCAPPKNAQ